MMSIYSPTELQQFCEFIAPQMARGDASQSLEDAVERFREYQRQMSLLHAKIDVAERQSAAGESGPFDAEATKAAVRKRLLSDPGQQ